MSNIKRKTIEAWNTEVGKNFKQPQWIRMQRSCVPSQAV